MVFHGLTKVLGAPFQALGTVQQVERFLNFLIQRRF
jgi:hypothetical protein